MARERAFSRRRLVGGTAGGAAAVALGGGLGVSRLQEALAARTAPAVIQGTTKLTYWGGLIFSDAANEMLEAKINEWGKANNVETEVVMINQNETSQKVSAAVESGTMPDALDLGLDLLLLLSTTEQLVPLDELYEKIGGAQGGWFEAIAGATDPSLLGGARTGIPFGSTGNVLFRRIDVLEPAGFTEAPATWEELREQAEAAQAEPLFGLGLALSNVGDGNLQVSVLQSFGGRIADDAGKRVTIKSEETRAYLEWVSSAYEAGLFPPGATTWDGAGDNTAYLSGQAVFIANPGSVYLALLEDDPELAEQTGFSTLPAGPAGLVSPTQPNVRAISANSQNPDAAMALIDTLADPAFMEEYYKVAIYGPVLKNQLPFEIFKGPVHAGLADLVQNGTAPAEPDTYNAAYAEFNTNFLVPKMVQRVVVDGYDFDRAMDEAQQQGQAIYDKYP